MTTSDSISYCSTSFDDLLLQVLVVAVVLEFDVEPDTTATRFEDIGQMSALARPVNSDPK